MATQGQVFGVPQIINASPLASAKMLVGNSSGIAAPVDLSGAITVTNAGVTTLGAGSRLFSKIITVTRDLTVASGNVAYTGVGFQPTSCLALGEVGSSLTQYVTIFGMADSSGTSISLGLAASTITRSGSLFIYEDVTGANVQIATIASYDADGLTLTWTKTGTPTGTATGNLLCFR